MVNKLVRIAAFFVCILPGWVYALGLSDIELNSYLNEQLDAKIELLSATQADLDSLKVSLASRADFARSGLEYHNSLYMLKFAVETTANGKSYIKVTTKENFREPFLNFLIELDWGKGRIIREYTLLIDPPTLVAAPPVITEAATTPFRAQEEKIAPAPTAAKVEAPTQDLFPRIPIEETAPAAAQTPVQPSGKVASEYATQRNDTLWGIAQKVRPDRAVSVEQAMMSLYHENPEAFMGENINRLKAGYVLKVPEAEVMSGISTAQAKADVRRHYEAWKALRSQAKRTKAPQAQVSAPVEPSQPQGKLEIMAPHKEESEPLADDVVGEDTTIDAGQVPVMAEAAGQQQDTNELRTRVNELEEEIRNMERMAAVRDQEMAALQRKLAELSGSEAPVEQEVAEPEVPKAAAIEEEAKEVAEAAKPEIKKPEPVKKATPAPKPAAEEKGLVDTVMAYVSNNPMMSGIIGGAVLLVLVILSMLVRQRRHAATGGEFNESILRERRPATPVVAEPEQMATAEEPVAEEPEEQVQEEQEAEEEEGAVGSSYLSDFAVSSMGNLHQTSEADPLTEADVFLAYGRFQPAEAMIREAIESQPERVDLKLKLMEIFYAAKDQEAFEKEAKVLQESMSGTSEWDKIEEMGKDLCPASPLFNEGAEAPADVSAGENAEAAPVEEEGFLDTMEFERPKEETKAPVAEAPSNEDDDRLLEFDTTDMAAATDFTETEESPQDEGVITEIAEAKGDSLLDFDLGDFGTESSDSSTAADDAVSGDDMSLDFDLDDSNLSPAPQGKSDELPETLVMTPDSSIEEMVDVAGGLDSDTDRVAEELANELEELAGSFDLDDAATTTEAEGEEPQDFSFDTVEPGADEQGSEEAPLGDDEVDTKLDLAKAYIDMGDPDGARSILEEVLEEGNDQQKSEANDLISQL